MEVGDQMVSLRCPLTLRRLRHAAKGEKCAHVQCFDIEVSISMSFIHILYIMTTDSITALRQGRQMEVSAVQ